MPHILMIATGGTIACCETAHGLSPALDSAALLGALPELSALCTVETLDLMQLDSTDVTAADRQRMAQAVWQNREKFDGFVLTHGTDTLAYTAALLTHLLPHFDKPLVLTGSMLPMGVPDSITSNRGCFSVGCSCSHACAAAMIFACLAGVTASHAGP